MSTLKNLVKQVLTEKENRRYGRLLEKRCISYDSWIREQEQKAEGTLKHAEALIQKYFAEHSEVQILYGDEDVQQGAERSHPWYKPDWSPDLFDSWYYFGSLVAVRRELFEKCPCPAEWAKLECDGFLIVTADENMDGEKQKVFVGWVRKCLEICGGWQRGCRAVGHISEILYHCDCVEGQERFMQWETGTVRKECACKEGEAEQSDNMLSIIIPSKDHPDILKQCVRSVVGNEKKLNYELIIVDNGSSDENKSRIEEMLRKCGQGACHGIKYIYRPMEFNFSGMCNLGAEHAAGNLLLFLNDDVELCGENCLSELAHLALREYTGAVGMKLYYPNSKRIQHAGITNLPMGPVHKLQFLEDDRVYYFNANRGLRNVLAVTAACLMVEKKKFLEVQGFAEDLQVAFNDVEFCFKLYELGYYNVCNNKRYAYHHESLSRGDDESTEKWLRLLQERDVLYSKHPSLEGIDPYYGVGLGREGLDTRVRPEYETAGNRIQVLQNVTFDKNTMSTLRSMPVGALSEYRRDNCLLLRIENCRQGILQGYGVVLGDNNACYEKELVLEMIEPEEADKREVHTISIEGQYRPDLVENMPDQINVGLSGFWMKLPKEEGNCLEEHNCFPKGNYRIGMIVRNRVTGLKLINWSSRILTVE